MRAILLIPLALFGCATPATEAEKDAAYSRYYGCLQAEARRLDDGRSDAYSVGAAIAPLCQSLFFEWVDTLTRDAPTPRARVLARGKVSDRQPAIAAQAVLEGRRK